MKRTIISTLLLCVLAIVLYFLWSKFQKTDTLPTPDITNSGSVADALQQATGTTTSGSNDDVTISSGDLSGGEYAGGGEYKQFFPQTAKQALGDGKTVVLYFYSPEDPTDQALDKDIQERNHRIPNNVIILRVNYVTDKSLVDSFDVAQTNTLIYLDKEGSEKTRRAVGITSLTQIVNALKEIAPDIVK